MAKSPRAPFLSYPQLRERAEGFLAEYHPDHTIPIPIEEIIDQKLEIDILPLAVADEEIESFTSHDMKTIYMSKSIYESENTNRYRFSLAHELSHIILHKDIFKNAGFRDVNGWKEFTKSFGEDYKWIEWQAYALAGLLLVPTSHLSAEYSSLVKSLEVQSLDIRNFGPNELNRVAKYLGGKFAVSSMVIHKRAKQDRFWNYEE